MSRAMALLLFISMFAMNLMACDGVLAGPIENVQEFTDKVIRSVEEGSARQPAENADTIEWVDNDTDDSGSSKIEEVKNGSGDHH